MHFTANGTTHNNPSLPARYCYRAAARKDQHVFMIGIVIVTHGRLAQEIISAMEHMVGPQSHLRAVCIGPEDDIERRQREIAAAAKAVDMGNGVVIATDMYGGTPCNLALTLLERGKIEVLAGANLPSLIKLVDIRNRVPLDQAVKESIEAGRKYMRAGSIDLAGGQ
jgi:PTS system mannose-specific IIA component